MSTKAARVLLEGASLEITPGEHVAMVGANNSGKEAIWPPSSAA
jgi:ABC-type polysaccharide/polyol phosphate transport system ATPase subunit